MSYIPPSIDDVSRIRDEFVNASNEIQAGKLKGLADYTAACNELSSLLQNPLFESYFSSPDGQKVKGLLQGAENDFTQAVNNYNPQDMKKFNIDVSIAKEAFGMALYTLKPDEPPQPIKPVPEPEQPITPVINPEGPLTAKEEPIKPAPNPNAPPTEKKG